MDNMGVGLGLAFGDLEMGLARHRSNRSMGTTRGEESGESVVTSPAPAYHSIEGFNVPPPPPMNGIRVDVEKTMSQI